MTDKQSVKSMLKYVETKINDQEQMIEHTKEFYKELSKQLGTNGRYVLTIYGKWFDRKERTHLTNEQFVSLLIKLAKEK